MTRFVQVGETEVRFEVDVNHHLRYYQRIMDFLAGMGVEPMGTPFEFIWTFQMTMSQKERWDKWFAALDRTQ